LLAEVEDLQDMEVHLKEVEELVVYVLLTGQYLEVAQVQKRPFLTSLELLIH
tara:strand:- start:576 stop:731 length:156 start_codon:yes stop_codon:yes gene_type:complete